MPRYDYLCQTCNEESEGQVRVDDRHKQVCAACSGPLTLIYKPQVKYVPFNGYFDTGLGVEVTGRMQRQKIMGKLSADFRDPPSRGDTSARLDRIAEQRRSQARAR
jgi:putative FmdB family regulatory protein